jgi:hypothetical protein
MAKLEQHLQGWAEVTDRCPSPQSPSLGCLRYSLRSTKGRGRRTWQKLPIAMQGSDAELQTIEITFLPKPLPGTPLPAPEKLLDAGVRLLTIPVM